jgi:hypothetical protein
VARDCPSLGDTALGRVNAAALSGRLAAPIDGGLAFIIEDPAFIITVGVRVIIILIIRIIITKGGIIIIVVTVGICGIIGIIRTIIRISDTGHEIESE